MAPVAPVMPMISFTRSTPNDTTPNSQPRSPSDQRVLGVGPLGVERLYRLSSTRVIKRQTSGSVICTSCGVLVGVNDETCYNCGRRNPGLWGYAPAIRALGGDLGFVPFVIGTCVVLYALTLIFS